MAGTLPDVPGHRFMYDRDGSLVLASNNGSGGLPLLPIDATILNDEDDDGHDMGNSSRDFVIVFPEPRDITGLFLRVSSGPTNIQSNGGTAYSQNTTDGTDGTWTPFAPTVHNSLFPQSRTAIQSLSLSQVKGIRFRTQYAVNPLGNIQNIHLFGSIAATANPDRVEFWHPTADSILDKAALDFGDMPLGSTKTKTLRIKNLSSSKTATGTVVNANNTGSVAANDAMVAGLEFSLDGGPWSASVTVPTLAPGAISPVISVRRTVGPTEAVTNRWARFYATPTSFA